MGDIFNFHIQSHTNIVSISQNNTDNIHFDDVFNLNKEISMLKPMILFADHIILQSNIIGLLTDKNSISLWTSLPWFEEEKAKIKEIYLNQLLKLWFLDFTTLNTFNINQFMSICENEESFSTIKELKENIFLQYDLLNLITFKANLEHNSLNGYPLIDDVMQNMININIPYNKNSKVAALGVNLLLNLPSIENVTIDELVDIRKELEKPLIRFRKKIIEYSNSLQSIPQTNEFSDDCDIIYTRDIVPACNEINERLTDNRILKNLGFHLLSDENFIKGLGGLVLGIAAAGTLATAIEAVPPELAGVTGAAWLINKLVATYKDHSKIRKDIERNDIYFYYQAHKRLSKKQ